MTDKTITTWAAFWPFYLGEHSLAATRWCHFVGSSLAVALAVTMVVTQRWWLFPVAFVQGYAWAWVSHFFIEKNRPATFTYPAWSFAGDWKMWAFMLTGRLDAELKKHGVQPKRTSVTANA